MLQNFLYRILPFNVSSSIVSQKVVISLLDADPIRKRKSCASCGSGSTTLAVSFGTYLANAPDRSFCEQDPKKISSSSSSWNTESTNSGVLGAIIKILSTSSCFIGLKMEKSISWKIMQKSKHIMCGQTRITKIKGQAYSPSARTSRPSKHCLFVVFFLGGGAHFSYFYSSESHKKITWYLQSWRVYPIPISAYK